MFKLIATALMLLGALSLVSPATAVFDMESEAEAALMAGDIEAALGAYMELVSVNPDDAELLDVAVLLAQEAEAAELGVTLVLNDLDRAIVAADFERIQTDLDRLTELGSLTPAWVDEILQSASTVSDEQADDMEMWLELNAESEALMAAGDFESAFSLAEGALMLAESTFGESHWFTIASARDFGFTARQLGDAAIADEYYGLALALSAEVLGPAHPRTQEIAGLMAELYTAAGAAEEAQSIREMMTEAYQAQFGDLHTLTLSSMVDQVAAIERAADYDMAQAMLAEVCAGYELGYSRYHPLTLDCMRYLGRLHRNTGSLSDAAQVYRDIADSYQASTPGITSDAVSNLMSLADIYNETGDTDSARALLVETTLLARQMGARHQSYLGKTYLARNLAIQGELTSALALQEDVVAYGQQAWVDNPLQYYNVLLELGGLYQRLSRFDEAEEIFEDAMLGLLELVGERHPSTLVAMNNLGNLYEQLGLYDDAEPVLKQTLEGMEASLGVAHPQTARTRNNLALLHESQGNFREAEPLYNTSFEHIVTALGEDHPDAIGMQNNLAFLYMMMEEYETAATMFEDLVVLWGETFGPDHQDALKSLNNLGRAYRQLGRFDEAETVVIQALDSRRENLGERHIDTIRSLIDLGAIQLDQGRLEEAEVQLRLALKLAEEEIGEQHPYTFEALNQLARVIEAKGELGAAVTLRELGLTRRSTFLDTMLWVTGENAREGYIRLHRPELDDYLALLTRWDDPSRGKKAIEASLQRKGLLLKITSEIAQISQLSTDPRLALISSTLEDARKELASLTLSGPTIETSGRHAEALYELELRVNELQGELGRASVRYRSSIAGVTADSVAQALADNTALVDFLVYRDGDESKAIAGVILKQDGDVRYDLIEFPDRDEIELAVLDFRAIIQDDLADEDEIMESGQYAYDLVWAPIRETIDDMAYVYLVPDGVLNILPFNALMNEDEEYLLQTTDVHILTSGRDLLPNDYELAEGEYVILAGPDYDANQAVGEAALAEAQGRRSAALQLGIRGAGGGLRGLNFAPLPGAEQEGRIITQQVQSGEADSDVYFGAEAQERVLSQMTETPEILHMATHGFFLEADDTLRKRLLKMQRSSEIQVPPPGDNPLLRAGLAFAGINSNAQFLGDIDTVNDGVLTALEVLSLDLSGTRLVVLSACETGLGEIHEGEGVYGLRRSFQEAGVAEVVSSLWEVSDAGTQALMTDFYDRILNGTPAREALRDTQLAMLDSPEWGYPYIWSAFMIVGSYESAGFSTQ